MIARPSSLAGRLRSEDGFTLLIALGVMFVTSLLLVAAFTAGNLDSKVSHASVVQQQAYYAALSGVQEYEYKLESNADYWENCESLSSTEESGERYEVSLQAAAGKEIANCKTSPFETVIESSGYEANTFRVVSIGCAGKTALTSCPSKSEGTVEVTKLAATFKVAGFLDYAYFTQYEDVDPALNGTKSSNCEKYYEEKGVKRSEECTPLEFAKEDSVNGPMHTDDAAKVNCSKELTFGRKEHSPLDAVEINGGTWPTCGSGSEPTYYTTSKTYEKGVELIPPESDESLGSYVESEDQFQGVTKIYLNGTGNEIGVYSYSGGVWTPKIIPWPKNGLIYVENNHEHACEFKYSYTENDNANTTELNKEQYCGIVYVEGTYSKSLTIGAQDDVVVTGNTYPTTVTKLGSAPTGAATLGLIASNFVRVYHPCSSSNETGYIPEPFIYAAILSTSHSFLVDAYKCGAAMKNLNVYGAIAQKFRGPVAEGTGSSITHGYSKEYTYDSRLASEEPPYFLSPLKSGWKVIRLTSSAPG